ncbi:hypothetical protein HO173_003191 [Letharia columbiana]|uniref:Uncharacterized protein n=1 Tax=Letharia columbiana TaxID=112416 RepID=A0A8H6G1K1_9LECA|nr:uncharacterized protein HO173_003191 [Letharia columbiana]KAF6238685.1 hypothetical protein HO173_003191 [Letharia columbiana]
MKVRLPPDKLERARKSVKALLNRRSIPHDELESAVGSTPHYPKNEDITISPPQSQRTYAGGTPSYPGGTGYDYSAAQPHAVTIPYRQTLLVSMEWEGISSRISPLILN